MAANKQKSEIRMQRIRQEEQRRKLEESGAKAQKLLLILFGATILLALVGLIVMLVTDAVYIHNTGMTDNNQREVAVSGAAFLKALFSGNYTSAEAGYDDIAVPFYLYAKAWCPPAAVFTLLGVVMTVLTVLASAAALFFALRKKDFRWTIASVGATALLFVMTVVVYAVCLSMSGSQILPVYCSGNPACSIRSDLIWCVLLSALMLAGNIFALCKYLSLEKQRKALAG